MKAITRLGAALGLAMVAGTSTARADLPDLGSANTTPIIATSETITVYFLYSLASADNDLYLFNNGAGVPGVFLIAVAGSAPVPGVGAPLTVTFTLASMGLNIGDELIFGICTTNTGGDPDGCADPRTAFYTGDPLRNPDGVGHVSRVTADAWNALPFGADCPLAPDVQACDLVVGFENRTATDDPPSDNDYNDLVFGFVGVSSTVVPEPATMGLLAIGLVGMSGASLIRRRNKKS